MVTAMIDKKKKETDMCSAGESDAYCMCTVQRTVHTYTLVDRLANTAGLLSRDLQHTISCKHRTRYKLTQTHSSHCRLFTTDLSENNAFWLLIFKSEHELS